MLGHSNPKTLRIKVQIGNKELTILIDGNSNGNFIQDQVVKLLGLQIS